jgi:hypothetical protein
MANEAEMIKKVDKLMMELAGTDDLAEVFNQPEKYRRLAEALWRQTIQKKVA